MLVEAALKIRGDYCSKCSVCSSACPFEAILADEKTGELVIDIEECRLCGLCFSACPASAIDVAYYNRDLLIGYVKKCMQDSGLDKLVLRCQSTLLEGEVRDKLEKHGINKFISLRVPCVGRIPPEFVLRMLVLGIRKIAIVLCKGENCRFEKGSNIGLLRFSLMKSLLKQLGVEEDALIIIRSLVRAHVDSNRCIGCGNCVYTCAYDAIQLGSPGVAQINEQVCWGCGACVAVCPALAISLDEFNHNSTPQTISHFAKLVREAKQKNGKPTLLVFYCQWANFPALSSSHNYLEGNTAFLEMPCSSALDPVYVLQAFYEGFDGVLVVACKKGECRFEEGNELAERRVATLKKLLAQLNLDDRLEICFTSPKYLGELENHIRIFTNKLESSM